MLRPAKATAWVAAAALILGGCSLVPDYRRPETDLPAAWSGKTGVAEGPPAVAVDGSWWKRFGSPELAALVAKGLSGNFSLQAAAARIDEAGGTAEVAGARLAPAIDALASRNKTNGLSPKNQNQIFVQASYEIDLWGRNRATADSAKALTQVSAFDRDAAALSLAATIANTYFTVLSLGERIGLARSIVGNARRILDLVVIQAAGGIASDLEVAQQRNAVATFEAALPPLEQQLEQARHALAVLVGAPPGDFAVGAPSLSGVAVPEVQPGLPSELLARRPDIRSAEEGLVAANFDVGAARAAFYPSFSMTTVGGVESASLAQFFPITQLSGLLTTVAQPLFRGGALEGQLAFDRAHVEELAATYRQTVLTALQDVEDALTALARIKELAAVDQAAVDAGRQAARLADARFRLGTTNFLTVLDTERTLYQAEDALLQVRLLRLQAVVGLFRALGGGFAEDARNPGGL